MKIVRLTSENVKRISAVTIEPNGSLIVIGGRNGQGKSSVLDSIMYALGGADSMPSRPLRNGSDSGKISVDLGDMVVTRKFTRNGDDVRSTLEIKNKDGFKASSPQALLDSLCGRMAFDPLEFSRMKPKQQLDALKELVGLDFTEQDRDRARLFEKRTDVNRLLKTKTAELSSVVAIPDVPSTEVSVSDLLAELEKAEATNRYNDELREKLNLMRLDLDDLRQEVSEADEHVADLERQLEEAKAAAAEARAAVDQKVDDVASFVSEVEAIQDVDTTELRERIRTAEVVNANVRHNQRRTALAEVVAAIEKDADSYTQQIQAIDQAKAAKMASAPFPVPGLGFDAEGITLNGLPFSQASSAEQLRVSVAMGLALNPKLRVMLIRDGSLLDEESLSLVNRMADEAGAQIWVERVSQGDEVSVVIEDGHVKEEVAELVEA